MARSSFWRNVAVLSQWWLSLGVHASFPGAHLIHLDLPEGEVRRGLTNGERIYFYGSPRPNVLVDITPVLPAELAGLNRHRFSQGVKGPWSPKRRHGDRAPTRFTEALYRLV